MYFPFLRSAKCTGSLGRMESEIVLKNAILNTKSNFLENYEVKITEGKMNCNRGHTYLRAHEQLPTYTWTPTHMILREHQ